jgi:TAT (twin-arginine translocation) pathway signal sequence
MNRRQFLKTTTAITAATLGGTLSPAVGRTVEPVNRSTAHEMTLNDPRAPLVDQETFAQIAELELRQAIRLQYYVSALALWIDTGEADLPKRLSSYRSIAEAIRDDIRSTDVLSVKPAGPSLQILLVGAYLDNLPGIIGRMGAAVKGHGVSVGGACFPTTARDRVELFHVAEAFISDPRSSTSEVSRSLRRSAARRFRIASSLGLAPI